MWRGVRKEFGYWHPSAITAASGNTIGISRYLFQSIIDCQKAACTLKNKVQAAFYVSALCGQCFQ